MCDLLQMFLLWQEFIWDFGSWLVLVNHHTQCPNPLGLSFESTIPPTWVAAHPSEGGHQLQAASPPPGWGINAGSSGGTPPSGQWDVGWPHFLQGWCHMDQLGSPMVDGHLSVIHTQSRSNMKHIHKNSAGSLKLIIWSINLF